MNKKRKREWLKGSLTKTKQLLSFILCVAILGTTVFPDNGEAFASSLGIEVSSEEAELTQDGFTYDETIANPDPRFGEPEDETPLNLPRASEAEIIGEIFENRSQYQKDFLLSDNTNLVVVYPEAVHYEEDGEWKEIDNALEPELREDGTTVLKNAASVLDVELPQTLSGNNEIALTYDGYRISFRLEGAVTPLESEDLILPVLPDDPIIEITPIVPEDQIQMDDGQVDVQESESGVTDELNVPEMTPFPTESEVNMEETSEEVVEEVISLETVTLEEESPVENLEPVIEDELISSIPGESAPVSESVQEPTALTAGMFLSEDIMVVEGQEEELMQMRLPETVVAAVNNETYSEAELSTMSAREQKIVSAFSNSEVSYQSVLPETDIIYNLSSTSLKESIVMASCPEEIPNYRYFIQCDDLSLELQTDNSILAENENGEVIFTLPAPFIVDDAGEYTYDIITTLETVVGGYRLTYHLPEEWMRADEREWPLVLDPVVNASRIRQDIQDHYVASNKSTNYNSQFLEAGYHATDGKERIYIKFESTNGTSSLPTLSSADVIVDARLQLYRGNSYYASAQMNVHKVTEDWESSSLQWANQPDCDLTNIADFDKIVGTGWYSWEITEIARSWYTEGNYGVMLKLTDEVENGGETNTKSFYSSDHSAEACRPLLLIQYMNTNGAEGYWDYDTYDGGRAGAGSVNLFSGNLVWNGLGLAYDGSLMPVALHPVYNSNDRESSFWGMGYGWKMPYHQRIVEWEYTNTSGDEEIYYIWTDEDGTKHYFEESGTNEYKDESGLELTLKTEQDGEAPYIMSDKKDNKRLFDGNGRLIKIQNNQATASAITITYVNPGVDLHIDTITDGAGREYRFVYDENARLTSVEYMGKLITTGTGTGEPEALKTIEYEYDPNTHDLVKVTYPDNESISFGYENHLLNVANDLKAGSTNRYILFSYDQIDMGQPSRVTRVCVANDIGESNSSGHDFDYIYYPGYTVVEDEEGRETHYQFNKYGNTISIKDAEGKAVFAKYDTEHEESVATGGKVNRLRESSKLQTTVRNYLKNPSFETDEYWSYGPDLGASGSGVYTSEQKYLGQKSCRLIMENTTGCVQVGTPQQFTVKENTMYTFSAYVKANFTATSGNGLRLVVDVPGKSYFSEVMKQNIGDWTRLDLTLTTPENVEDMQVWVRLETPGTVYVDCVQLCEGPTAARYNLVENGDFTLAGSAAGDAYGWSEGSGIREVDVRTEDAYGTGANQMDNFCFTMVGDIERMKRIYQDVAISGEEGDVFSLSGWAKGDVGAITDSGRVFAMVARFYNGTEIVSELPVEFNADLSGDTWQYACERLVAKDDYTHIRILLVHEKNVNQVWFDGIQLVKDEYGNSYQYDDDGNVISTIDLQSKNSTYDYDETTNNLLSAALPGGGSMEYEYDGNHNVTEALSGGGQKTLFGYDEKGRNISVKRVDSTGTYPQIIESKVEYAESDDSYPSSMTDSNLDTVTFGYNQDTGELEWLQDPLDTDPTKVTEYFYDSFHRLTGVSKTVDTLGAPRANITYSIWDDRIESITHTNIIGKSTEYRFNYDFFNLIKSVRVGSRTLITNTYDTQDSDLPLTLQTYGNGNTVSYTYDDMSRLVKMEYEDGEEISYDYDSEGNLGKLTDSANRFYYKYYYDLSGRLSKIKEAGAMPNWQYVAYDDANNVSQYKQEIGGTTYITDYTYDEDNRQTQVVSDKAKKTWNIDNYGRIHSSLVYHNNAQVLRNYFQYHRQDPAQTTNTSMQMSSLTLDVGSSTAVINYEYDGNGNITSVTHPWSTTGKTILSGSNVTISYEYDDLQQLVRENNPIAGKTWIYAYDSGGNILSKTEYDYTTGTVGNPNVSAIKNYTYGDTKGWKDLLTRWNGNYFEYDAIGNLTDDGTWTYTWEHGRQLAEMSNGDTTISYTYAPDGMRRTKSDGSNVYSYYYNGSLLTHMYKGSQYIHITYDAAGVPISIYYSQDGQTYYYVLNQQGDVIGLVDSNGNMVVEYAYDAWGNPIVTTGSKVNTVGALNPLRYRGYIYDTDTELYYLTSRYYNPEIGRFINADGYISTGQGFLGHNMFAYCENNPVNRKDSTGHFGITALLVLATVIIGAVSLSGCSEPSPSSPPADYVPNDSTNQNCYSYAFNLSHAADPGGYSKSDNSDYMFKDKNKYTPDEIVDFVKRDMEALNKSVRVVNSPADKLDNEYIVAMKTSTMLIPLYNIADYHFAVQLSDGSWADKRGTNPSRWNALDGTALKWDFGIWLGYYDTESKYFAVER